MNIFVSFLLMLLSVSTFATAIDNNLESIIIDDPSLQGKYFCAFDNLDSMVTTAAFICDVQGYKYSEVTGTGTITSSNARCLQAYDIGTGFNILTRNSLHLVIRKVKCFGFKPPSTQPCVGCDDLLPLPPKPKP